MLKKLAIAEVQRRIDHAESVISFDLREWGRLLVILLPEVYADAGQPDEPTRHLPKTVEREQVLAERARKRQALFHPADARVRHRDCLLATTATNGVPAPTYLEPRDGGPTQAVYPTVGRIGPAGEITAGEGDRCPA